MKFCRLILQLTLNNRRPEWLPIFSAKITILLFLTTSLGILIIFLSCNLSTVNYNFVNEKNLSSYVSSESNYLARLILLKISDYYFLDDFDEIFATRFILHINNLLKRLHSNFSVRNPMAKDIMKTYPLIFDISVFVADIIQQETGYVINRDEISLIALHIGSFIESSKLTKASFPPYMFTPIITRFISIILQSFKKNIATA